TSNGGITINSMGGLTLTGTASFAPGAGQLSISDLFRITLSSGTYTVTNGAGVFLSAGLLQGISGGTSTIAVSQTSTTITITSPYGFIEIGSSGSGNTNINLLGSFATITSNFGLTVDHGVTLTGDNNFFTTLFSPNMTIAGTVQAG